MTNEQERMENKGKQILQALRLAGNQGLTNVELSKMALRYGGYLGKFYKQGYKIKKDFIGDGVYKYTLIHEPEEEVVWESAIDKLLSAVESSGTVTKDMLKDLLEDNHIMVKYKANTYK